MYFLWTNHFMNTCKLKKLLLSLIIIRLYINAEYNTLIVIFPHKMLFNRYSFYDQLIDQMLC